MMNSDRNTERQKRKTERQKNTMAKKRKCTEMNKGRIWPVWMARGLGLKEGSLVSLLYLCLLNSMIHWSRWPDDWKGMIEQQPKKSAFPKPSTVY